MLRSTQPFCQKHKKMIEEVALFLGWTELSWSSMRKERITTYTSMTGRPPSGQETKQGWREVFPPSTLDGNGMLWLMSRCIPKTHLGVQFSIGWDTDKESSVLVNPWDSKSLKRDFGRAETPQTPDGLPLMFLLSVHAMLKYYSDEEKQMYSKQELESAQMTFRASGWTIPEGDHEDGRFQCLASLVIPPTPETEDGPGTSEMALDLRLEIHPDGTIEVYSSLDKNGFTLVDELYLQDMEKNKFPRPKDIDLSILEVHFQ